MPGFVLGIHVYWLKERRSCPRQARAWRWRGMRFNQHGRAWRWRCLSRHGRTCSGHPRLIV